MSDNIIDLPDEIRAATLSKKLRWIANEAIRKVAENSTGSPLAGTPVLFYRTGTRGRPYSDVSTARNAVIAANKKLGPSLGGHFVGSGEVDPPGSRSGWLIVGFVPDEPSSTNEGLSSDHF